MTRSLHLSILLGGAFLVPSPRSQAQGTLQTFSGDTAGEHLGNSVADAGDVDLDGHFDVIVGARLGVVAGVPVGTAEVFSGHDGSLLFTFAGAQSSDFFGFSVSGAGDVDNDGHPDVIVGAPQGDYLQFNNGSAHVFSGMTGASLYTWGGLNPNTEFGHSVSDVGDVDLDGFVDVVVASYRDHPNGNFSGGGFVFSGKDGTLLHYLTGDAAGDYLGWSVSGAGDVNADGRPDVVVGMLFDDDGAFDAGGARVYSGLDGSILHQWFGDGTNDKFGRSVAGIGDVDNDGFDDVVVGIPEDDDGGPQAGSIRAYSGQTGALLLLQDGVAPERLGWSVSGADDVDGDLVPDLLVGAPYYASQRGRVLILSGADASTISTIDGPLFSFFGDAVSRARDANADGFPDIVVGAPLDPVNGTNSGSARIISTICGNATPYGFGCPGDGGFQPTLEITGCPTPGGTVTLTIDKGVGGGLTYMFFGTGQSQVPIGIGCPLQIGPLLPPTFVFALPGSGPGNGFVSVSSVVFPNLAGTVTIDMQALIIDAAAAGGYSSTKPLELEVL